MLFVPFDTADPPSRGNKGWENATFKSSARMEGPLILSVEGGLRLEKDFFFLK